MSPDVSLLERWVQYGDADAFAELVARYSRLVCGTCRRILGNATEAEDVAQEAFIELATRGHGVETSVGSWLHAVATHRALNHLRSGKRRKAREQRFIRESASAGEANWEDVWQHVDEAIAALPENLREPIVLRFIDGKTQDWIARDLDVAPATVRYRLDRGVEEIRKRLRKKGVVVGAASLAAAMTNLESAAAPASLTAALGRVALAGVRSSAGAKLALAGGVAMTMKKTVVAVCAVVFLAGLGTVFWKGGKEPGQVPAPAPATASEAKNEVALPAAAPQPAPAEPPSPSPAAEDEVPAQEEPPAIEPASVAGLVTTPMEEPVPNAPVELEVLVNGQDLEVAKTYRTTTGVDGRYRIDNVDTLGDMGAEVSVYASKPGYLMAKLRGLMVSSGEVTQADLALKEARHIVGGIVLSESRAPLPGASVELQYYGYTAEGLERTATTGTTTGNIGDPKWVFTRTGEDGRFEIGIPAEGFCDFTVRKEGYGPGFFPQIATSTTDAVFVLKTPGAISGHVKNADGAPAPGVVVEVIGAGFPGGLAPYPVWVQPLLLRTVKETTGADGSYLAEGLGEEYWYRVSVPEPGWPDGEEKLLAQVLGVTVRAGKTTTGVDLTLPPEGRETAIVGEVTDIVSGEPVYPMAVDVLPTDKNPLSGGLAQTIYWSVLPDGTFRIPLSIMKECDVVVRHRYETEGGGVWWDKEERIVRVKPFEETEVNFSVAAPFNVELEYVDESGAPLENIMTAMGTAERGPGCGGSITTGPDGRATMHGLPPGIPLVAGAWQDLEGRIITVGVSEPFTGSSGETLKGVQVVCRPITGVGGVSGVLLWPDGKPVGQTEVYCRTEWAGNEIMRSIAYSAEDGSFTSSKSLPEGEYAEFGVGFEDDEGRIYGVILSGVTIENGEITPLGTLTVVEVPGV